MKNYSKRRKTVVLHGNGGNVVDSQLSTMTVILIEGEPPKKLPFDAFERDGGIFLGWTANGSSTTPDDKYNEEYEVSYETLGDVVELNLWACWTMYQFSSDDTMLTFNSDEEQTYTIAEITIDKNAQLNGNAPLDDTLIVNFGDD